MGDVLISSRPHAQYLAQFALTDTDLRIGPVLDCPGGASDFTATLRGRGIAATAVDPCYGLRPAELALVLEAEHRRVVAWTSAQPGRFPLTPDGVWEQAPSWRRTSARFLADYTADRREGTGRYLAAGLPALPFPDHHFALAVSGFLLFTYPEHFDTAFHLAAVTELLRVARQVRLHPLNSTDGTPYPGLDHLLRTLHGSHPGLRHRIVPVTGQSDHRDDRTLILEHHPGPPAR
ncbi:hypothetical protein [Streptomyces sp. NPDC005955]|uniref:hypothetical protein n=1 Tax=Streptomyces sp. NPDC005955 TaxID=3364738 RepID=UPI00367B1FD2